MKKLIAMLLALVLLTSLFACSAAPDEEAAPDTAETVEPAPDQVEPAPVEPEEPTLAEQVAEVLKTTADAADGMKRELVRGTLAQQDMNALSEDIYNTWDVSLREIMDLMTEPMDTAAYDALINEHTAWTKDRYNAVDEAGLEFEGGSMRPMIQYDCAATMTRARCYELASRLGAEFTCALVKSYGLENGESHLGLNFADGDFTEENGVYTCTVQVYKPVLIPTDLGEGDSFSFCIDEIDNEFVHVTREGDSYISEDGREYYAFGDEDGDGLMELFHDSDDRMDCLFFEGPTAIAADAVFRVPIAQTEETFDPAKHSYGLYVNGCRFNDDGVITELSYYGD